MSNYGISGVSYELDENDALKYTDAVLHNPEIASPSNAVECYTAEFVPFFNIADKLHYTYGELTMACIDTWQTALDEYRAGLR